MMPTSVPGPASGQSGFTLLEMMIVLVIIGIATSLVSVSAFGDNSARALRQDAQRLAQLFTAAQAEARTSGHPIVWTHDEHGYRFSRLPNRLMLPARMAARTPSDTDTAITGSTALRPRDWTSSGPVAVRMKPDARLVFGADWIPGPLQMELEADGKVVGLLRLGNGRYMVYP